MIKQPLILNAFVNSKPPDQIGDKVLLADFTTRRGESSKLKYKYTGPFIVIEALSGYNYRLQHLLSGKDLKRPASTRAPPTTDTRTR